MERIKKIVIIACIWMLSTGSMGCAIVEQSGTKTADVDYTILEREELPQEVVELIEEKKEAECKLTFEDQNYLYIIRGYGKQETGGYSIRVDELYRMSDALYFRTTLVGPQSENPGESTPSFPYIVVRTDLQGVNVVFD